MPDEGDVLYSHLDALREAEEEAFEHSEETHLLEEDTPAGVLEAQEEEEEAAAAESVLDSGKTHEIGVDDVETYTPDASRGPISDGDDEDQQQGSDWENDDHGESEDALLNDNDAPMPYLTLFTLSCVIICDSLSITFIFPFLQWMVEYFAVSDDPHMLYVYAGILASSFSFAQCFSSMMFGSLSDRFGRRPILLIGLLVNALALLAFGFSQTYWQALLFRLIGGALNGNLPVAKTYMGEVTHPRLHQKVFSLVGLVWSTGTILGPVLGGFLAIPAELYPNVFSEDGLFGRNPFLLPCLVMAAIQVTGFVVGFFRLKESLPNLSVPALLPQLAVELAEFSHSDSVASGSDSLVGEEEADVVDEDQDQDEHLNGHTVVTADDEEEVAAEEEELSARSETSPSDDDQGSSSQQCDDTGAHRDDSGDHSQERSHEDSDEREHERAGEPTQTSSDVEPHPEHDTLCEYEQADDEADELDDGDDDGEGQLRVFGAEDDKKPSRLARARLFLEGLRRPTYTALKEDTLLKDDSDLSTKAAPLRDSAYRPSFGARVRLRLRPWFSSTSQGLWSVWEVIRIRNVLVVTGIYSLVAIQWIMFEETFSMWAKEAYETGGMSFSTKDIGSSFMVSGVTGLIVQLTLYAPLAERIGSVWTFRLGAACSVPFLFFFYFLNLIQPMRADNPVLFWAIFYFTFGLSGVVPVFQYTSIFVLITVSSPPNRAGTTQGFSQSVASLARGFGPLTGGILFALSLTTSFPFPFDVHLVTTVLAFFGVMQLVISLFFKNVVEHSHTVVELPIGE